PSPSAQTGVDRSPQICRGSRGRAALYIGPPDRLSAPRRVRGKSSGRHAEHLRRQAWLPHESTASPESLEGVDSALQPVMQAVSCARCLQRPRILPRVGPMGLTLAFTCGRASVCEPGRQVKCAVRRRVQSITRTACLTMDSGIVTPRAFAVLRLTAM